MRIFLFLSFFCACLTAKTNPVDTLQIEQIEVVSSRIRNFSTGTTVEKIDPLLLKSYQAGNLTQLLSNAGLGNLRSYGVNGLAGVSLRGNSNKHTAILWNGFNLNNPMNGEFNLVAIPNFFIDDVNIQYGGSGALHGSGSVGGAILLNNKVRFNEAWNFKFNEQITCYDKFGFNTEDRRFDNSQQGFITSYSNQWYSGNLKFFRQKAENKFPFYKGIQKKYQNNSGIEQWGILQENYFRLPNNQVISTHFWYQDLYREIPPNITKQNSEESQKDVYIKGVVNYKKYGNLIDWYARTALFIDTIDYRNPETNLIAVHNTLSSITEIESKLKLSNRSILNLGVNFGYITAQSDNFKGRPHQEQMALIASYKRTFSKFLTLTTSIREAFYNWTPSPVTPSMGLEITPNRNLMITGSISRNYKAPTFNDLFWLGGWAYGNPDLKPESGWSEDLGLKYKFPLGQGVVSGRISGFHNRIKDLIQWQCDSLGKWSPNNVEKVRNKGIEAEVEYALNLRTLTLKPGINYSYTSARDELQNRQLNYVPKHSGKAFLTATFKGYSFIYTQNYTGMQMLPDNRMDAYSVGNLAISKTFSLAEKRKINFNFQANNLWNASYFVMYPYPMPLRNYSFGLTLIL